MDEGCWMMGEGCWMMGGGLLDDGGGLLVSRSLMLNHCGEIIGRDVID
jgi:hypothetical protein